MPEQGSAATRVTTGVPGLDKILLGGYAPDHAVLIEGPPGAGKTTMALQFLEEGRRRGERGLHITMSETAEEVMSVAASHGFGLSRDMFFEIFPPLDVEAQFALFHPEEVGLAESTSRILEEVNRVKPRRLVIDSLHGLRMLFADELHFGRYVSILKRQLTRGGTTTLLLETVPPGRSEPLLETVAHSVIELGGFTREYGGQRRRLQVQKVRGSSYLGGYHDFIISTGGIEVFPRIEMSSGFDGTRTRETVSSGLPELDRLLGGGVLRGTSALLVGTTGTGKSAIAAKFAVAAAERGEPAAIYLFEEVPDTYLCRSSGLGMGIERLMGQGLLRLSYLDAATLCPGEFASKVAGAVERDGVRLVVIDSVRSYLNMMPGECCLGLQMHDLLAFLADRDVVTLLVMPQGGLFGSDVQSAPELAYLGDAVLVFRQFEAQGRVRKSLAVAKKSYGTHEDTIRELQLAPESVRLGPPLTEFRGVLSGNPVPVDIGTGPGEIEEENPS